MNNSDKYLEILDIVQTWMHDAEVSSSDAMEKISDIVYEDLQDYQERKEQEYYDEPITQTGWKQQDIIDMYRREK